jgi:Kef-type K+ transport system membrane component KefB
MRITPRHTLPAALAAAVLAGSAFAAGSGTGHGLDPTVLVGVAVILIFASLFAEIFEHFGQPAVLGELFAGIILGNLILVGFPYAESFKTDVVIEALAQFGVILLLFEVGLETNLSEMMKVGGSALLVACIGVTAPFFLGWLAAYVFFPDGPTLSHIFIGAMLTATSIGITARVLRDMGHISTREARIVLGAAVIDDVLALLLLGVVDSAIEASKTGGEPEMAFYGLVALKAVGFLIVAIVIGHLLIPRFFKSVRRFESKSLVIGLSIAICFLGAYIASMVGLAAIIGAFAAGVVLDEVHFEHFLDHKKHHLEDFLSPVSALIAPVFFVFVGLKVDLSAFGNPSLLGFAAAITLAAVVGKQLCAVGALGPRINRKAVGFGMIPRGEVVLFFAGVGATLFIVDKTGTKVPVISGDAYSAVVIMVIVTTLMTPPLLKWALDADLDRSEIDNRIVRLPSEK